MVARLRGAGAHNNNLCGVFYYCYLGTSVRCHYVTSPLRNVVFSVTLKLLVIYLVVVSRHQQTRPFTSD